MNLILSNIGKRKKQLFIIFLYFGHHFWGTLYRLYSWLMWFLKTIFYKSVSFIFIDWGKKRQPLWPHREVRDAGIWTLSVAHPRAMPISLHFCCYELLTDNVRINDYTWPPGSDFLQRESGRLTARGFPDWFPLLEWDIGWKPSFLIWLQEVPCVQSEDISGSESSSFQCVSKPLIFLSIWFDPC